MRLIDLQTPTRRTNCSRLLIWNFSRRTRTSLHSIQTAFRDPGGAPPEIWPFEDRQAGRQAAAVRGLEPPPPY